MPAMRPLAGSPAAPCPVSRPALALALALGSALLVAPAAQAQSLKELYEAARAYDATYLAAQALAQSADYRVAAGRRRWPGRRPRSTARRPIARRSAGGWRLRQQFDRRHLSAGATRSSTAATTPPSPGRKSLESARADLETAEQDLIVRVAQAYFDVLAAQDTLATCAPTRPPSPSSWPRPSATSRSAPRPSPTRARRRPASTRHVATRSRPRTTCAPSASRSTSWSAATAFRPSRWRCRSRCRRCCRPTSRPGSRQCRCQHPTVRRARVGLDVATLETEKARAAESSRSTRSALSGTRASGSTLSGFSGTTRVASIGVQFNLPLYTGGQTQNRIQETLLLEEKSRQDLDVARRGCPGTRQWRSSACSRAWPR
jgi:outer membrane protein